MIDTQNFFDQPLKHKLMTYDSIRKCNKSILLEI